MFYGGWKEWKVYLLVVISFWRQRGSIGKHYSLFVTQVFSHWIIRIEDSSKKSFCEILMSLDFWSKFGMLFLATFSVQFPLIRGCWRGTGISWRGHRILSAESLFFSRCTQGLWGSGPQAGSGCGGGGTFRSLDLCRSSWTVWKVIGLLHITVNKHVLDLLDL